MSKKNEILSLLKAGKIDVAEAAELLDSIGSEKPDWQFRPSEKGCMALYGIWARRRKDGSWTVGRPLSLYKNQWLELLDSSDKIRQELSRLDDRLKDWKEDQSEPDPIEAVSKPVKRRKAG